jgi:hypothetical protein
MGTINSSDRIAAKLYSLGCRVFPGGRMRPGHDADPSPASSSEV